MSMDVDLSEDTDMVQDMDMSQDIEVFNVIDMPQDLDMSQDIDTPQDMDMHQDMDACSNLDLLIDLAQENTDVPAHYNCSEFLRWWYLPKVTGFGPAITRNLNDTFEAEVLHVTKRSVVLSSPEVQDVYAFDWRGVPLTYWFDVGDVVLVRAYKEGRTFFSVVETTEATFYAGLVLGHWIESANTDFLTENIGPLSWPLLCSTPDNRDHSHELLFHSAQLVKLGQTLRIQNWIVTLVSAISQSGYEEDNVAYESNFAASINFVYLKENCVND